MANTYTQFNIHCVFAVKGRENILTANFREELFRVMSDILKNDLAYPLAVGGWKDHAHVFFELPPKLCVSSLIQSVKASSSKWINDRKLVRGKFQWQEGFGGFSHERSARDGVIKYIMHQEEHHRSKTFREEYLGMLKKFEIEFKDEYIFEFYDDLYV